MAFFHGQDTLTIMEWTIRAILTFFFMVVIAKMMGQRSISQLRLLDFVIALMLGNIIAHPLSDSTIGMKGSIITTIVIVMLYIFGVQVSLKWPRLQKVIEPPPFPLIKEGEISFKGLKKAKISVDYLLAELRKEKVEDVKKIALALWESDGKISIFLDPKFEPVTPFFFQKNTAPFDMPRVIIKDGEILKKELIEINRDERWIKELLKNEYNTQVEEILLATIDRNKQIKICFYKP